MKRPKWHRERDKTHAEARIDLVEAMEGYPAHVVEYVLLDYLKNEAHKRSSEQFAQEDNNA